MKSTFSFLKEKNKVWESHKVYRDIKDFKDIKELSINNELMTLKILKYGTVIRKLVLTFNFVCKSSLLVMMLVTSVSFNPWTTAGPPRVAYNVTTTGKKKGKSDIWTFHGNTKRN